MEEPGPARSKGATPVMLRILLAFGFVVAAGATALAVVSDDARLLRLAVVLALWAALLAAFAVTRSRREAKAATMRENEAQRAYQLELQREVSARHEFEADLSVRMAAAQSEQIAQLREQLDRLTDVLSSLADGELLVSRLTLSAESARFRSGQSVIEGPATVQLPAAAREMLHGAHEAAVDASGQAPQVSSAGVARPLGRGTDHDEGSGPGPAAQPSRHSVPDAGGGVGPMGAAARGRVGAGEQPEPAVSTVPAAEAVVDEGPAAEGPAAEGPAVEGPSAERPVVTAAVATAPDTISPTTRVPPVSLSVSGPVSLPVSPPVPPPVPPPGSSSSGAAAPHTPLGFTLPAVAPAATPLPAFVTPQPGTSDEAAPPPVSVPTGEGDAESDRTEAPTDRPGAVSVDELLAAYGLTGSPRRRRRE